MLTKRQFLNFYEEAVTTLKHIKLYNDKLNKKLGVSNTTYLVRQSQAQSEVVENMHKKVEEMIQKMEKSYLDPQTARKIGNVKQQLRNQGDRRNQLLDNLQEIAKTQQIDKKNNNKSEIKTMQMGQHKFSNEEIGAQKIQQQNLKHKNWTKRSMITEADSSQHFQRDSSQVMMQISDFDYDMERKLMHEKNKCLGEAHERITKVKSLVDQSQQMVNQQGQMLDIIGDDLFITHKNVIDGNEELIEANNRHRRFRGKICLLIFVILLAISMSAYIYFYLI